MFCIEVIGKILSGKFVITVKCFTKYVRGKNNA